MKILAFYLPQFHAIRENDEWWGNGFTEWENLKTAKPYFKGHYQPRIPLNKNYYNLTDVKTLKWQAELAKKYGIYGFVYYHYWSTQGMLLEKPAEIMLENKDIDLPFCFSWANHTWSRVWANKQNTVLWEQKYGEVTEWERHFNYLLKFFKDDRYIKIDGKPLMIIYNPIGVKEFPDMMNLWQKLSRENGFPGIFFIHQENQYDHTKENTGKGYEGGIEFQMNLAMRQFARKSIAFKCERVLNRIADIIPFLRCKATMMRYDYDVLWKLILSHKPLDDSWYPGAFVDWDNTPRRKNRGQVCLGVTAKKFRKYLTQQIKRTREVYHKDYLFIFAWNEWGESGYLEPDEIRGYSMLEAVKDALNDTNEFPKWE